MTQFLISFAFRYGFAAVIGIGAYSVITSTYNNYIESKAKIKQLEQVVIEKDNLVKQREALIEVINSKVEQNAEIEREYNENLKREYRQAEMREGVLARYEYENAEQRKLIEQCEVDHNSLRQGWNEENLPNYFE